MSGIEVDIRRSTEAGRLYPYYDSESEILVLESRFEREWTYGVDVDGSIVFDLDSDRILANCDLNIPMRLWARDLELVWPKDIRSGDIAFSKDTIAKKSFNVPLAVQLGHSGRYARISIGEAPPNKLIALSELCVAQLARDELVGFLIKLDQ